VGRQQRKLKRARQRLHRPAPERFDPPAPRSEPRPADADRDASAAERKAPASRSGAAGLPSPRLIGAFLFTFACVFGGLALPWAGFGASYSRAFSSVANGVISVLPSHPRLEFSFEGSRERPSPLALGVDSWQTLLWIRNKVARRNLSVPVDLRGVHYLPVATFIALSVAFPAQWRRKLVILGVGLAVLVPLSLLLVSVALIPGLRGGAFEILPASDGLSNVFVLFHRAFVAHPGMVYAIPGLLWWILVSLTGPGSKALDLVGKLRLPFGRPARSTALLVFP
jgi:hypothetical protein